MRQQQQQQQQQQQRNNNYSGNLCGPCQAQKKTVEVIIACRLEDRK